MRWESSEASGSGLPALVFGRPLYRRMPDACIPVTLLVQRH